MGILCKESSHFLLLFSVLIFINTLRGVYEGFNIFFCFHKTSTDPIDLDTENCGSFANLDIETNVHLNKTESQYLAACGGSWETADHCSFTFSNRSSHTSVVCDRYDHGDYHERDQCAFLPAMIYIGSPPTNQSPYFECKLSEYFTTCGISVATYKYLYAVQFLLTLIVCIFIILVGITRTNHLLDKYIGLERIWFKPVYGNFVTNKPTKITRTCELKSGGSETFDETFSHEFENVNCSYSMQCDEEFTIHYYYKNANSGVECSGSWSSNGFERHCLNEIMADLPNSFDMWPCVGGPDVFEYLDFEDMVSTVRMLKEPFLKLNTYRLSDVLAW